MRVLMWEAKGDADGLIAWLRAEILPTLPAAVSAELFRSGERVVVMVRWSVEADAVLQLPEPPAHLVTRPPHAWPFEAVEDGGEAGWVTR
jgi:hypothetical protein